MLHFPPDKLQYFKRSKHHSCQKYPLQSTTNFFLNNIFVEERISTICLTSKDFSNSSHSYRRTEIDVSCKSSTSSVIPVFIIGSQLFKPCTFHKVNPLWNFHFTSPIKKIVLKVSMKLNFKKLMNACKHFLLRLTLTKL